VHQPVAVSRPEDDKNLLHGHAEAIARWSDAGADIIAGGHIHLPFIMPLTGPMQPVWALQAGTALSSRTRGGTNNSVNVIRTAAFAGASDASARERVRTAADVDAAADIGSGPLPDTGSVPGHARHCDAERWDYSPDTRRFELVESRRLDLRPSALTRRPIGMPVAAGSAHVSIVPAREADPIATTEAGTEAATEAGPEAMSNAGKSTTTDAATATDAGPSSPLSRS
jgi:hypothetical protein